MLSNFFKKAILTTAIVIITLMIYDRPISSNSLQISFAQVQPNNTQASNTTDYNLFQSNIEQIIGHIKMAEFNKNLNNNTLAYNHTSHPIEEVLSIITIPLNNEDKKLNDTYFKDLYTLSSLVASSSPSSGEFNKTSKEEFNKQAQGSIELSNKVIKTVIPAKILNNTNHNITVIQDLLNTSKDEYGEGVQNGKIVKILEYQDGIAFMNRAYDIFNSTKTIANDRKAISDLFGNLTKTTEQQETSNKVNKIIDEINHQLSSNSSAVAAGGTFAYLPSSSLTTTNATKTDNINSSKTYISEIRSLLNQVSSTFSANDTAKAKELATIAYLDNFEHLEKPIGKELADKGEQLLRVQLRDQISKKASLDEIKQTINEVNVLLDKAQKSLNP
jgi:3-dehydroquinate dehydratase